MSTKDQVSKEDNQLSCFKATNRIEYSSPFFIVGLGTALAVEGSSNPEELQLFLQDSSELQLDVGDNQLRMDEDVKELSEKVVIIQSFDS